MGRLESSLAVLVLLGVVLVGGTGGAVAQQYDTVEGATIPIPDDIYAEWEDEIESFKERIGQPNSDAWLLYTDDWTFIVISDGAPDIGTARVTGNIYYESRGYGYIDLNEFEDTTDVRSVDGDQLTSSPEAYEIQTVRVSGTYTQSAFAYSDTQGYVSQPELHGTFGPKPRGLPNSPGRVGSYAAVNVSSEAENNNQHTYIHGTAFQSGEPMVLGHQRGYAIDEAEATVSGVVLPRHPAAPGTADGPTHLYLADVQLEADETVTVSEIADGDVQEGDVVRTSGEMAGTSFSAQKVAIAVSPCDGATTVGYPPVCVPAVTDASVEGGVVSDGDSMVPYGRVDNDVQDELAISRSGEVTLVGEIVDASSIHPGLDGYGIKVYRLRSTSQTRVSGEVAEGADTVDSRIREHMEVRSSEVAEYEQQQSREQTRVGPTPTPTPIPTPTPSPTPVPTDVFSTDSEGAEQSTPSPATVTNTESENPDSLNPLSDETPGSSGDGSGGGFLVAIIALLLSALAIHD